MLANTQNLLQMCSFDTNKSTKGASKLRRDLINSEIANLRDLLPLPSSTRQRLSQLQLMALVCVYVRKANYFQHVFRKRELPPEGPIPHFGFSKALSGFLMMMTQNGKLLYISDNAAEYLGHSMEDLLIHGDSVYDIIEKQDHQAIQAELMRSPNPLSLASDTRTFLCRMNVSRNARRQMRFGDQKVVLVEGHFVSYLPLCSRNEPVFLATCTPVAMPETRECVVQGSTTVFTSIHNLDMKFLHLDLIGECHLGYSKANLQGVSWYELVHWEHLREAQTKHRLITQSEQERSCIILLRLQESSGRWLWVHVVLQIKDGSDSSQQSVIVCTNQILSEKEAAVMRANSWLYQYYSLHSKMHYGLGAYDTHPAARLPAYYSSATVPYQAAETHTPYPFPLHHPTAPAPQASALNGSTSHHHHHHQPPPVLPYGGGLPYAALPRSESGQLWAKRPSSPSPPPTDEKRPATAATTSTFGGGDIVMPAQPPTYFGGAGAPAGNGATQIFAVPYTHLVPLRGPKVVTTEEEGVEQSLTPTNTEDVSAMISLTRSTSGYLPLASVISESNRVLCEADEFGRREDGRTYSLMSRDLGNGRLELPYVRYGGRLSDPYAPLMEFSVDPRRRFVCSPKPDFRPCFWNGAEYSHLADCFTRGDTSKCFFENHATVHESSIFRHRTVAEESQALSGKQEEEEDGNCGSVDPMAYRTPVSRLVRPSATPSPSSKTSTDG